MADNSVTDDLLVLERNVRAARKEIQSIRKDVGAMRSMFMLKFQEIENTLKNVPGHPLQSTTRNVTWTEHQHPETVQTSLLPIGYLKSCFKEKNGIPRQPSVCPSAKAELRVTVSNFTNPEHALEGLASFSHIWLLFIFHQNTNKTIRAKVKPPRLNGGKVGVFASRSPHRPNPIGLSLAKIDDIRGSTLFLSGIDILDGTPIIDIKPYIPTYDRTLTVDTQDCYMNKFVPTQDGELAFSGAFCKQDDTTSRVSTAEWLNSPPVRELAVSFSEEASRQLSLFHGRLPSHLSESQECAANFGVEGGNSPVNVALWHSSHSNHSSGVERQITPPDIVGVLSPWSKSFPRPRITRCSGCGEPPGQGTSNGRCVYGMTMFSSVSEVRQAIRDVLKADPRSVYRRNQCAAQLYHFSIDKLNVTCRFDSERVEVLSVRPSAFRTDKEVD